LAATLEDSTNITPVIFVITPGSDPISDLMALAKVKNMTDRLKIISLGQGQGPEAANKMDEGQRTGNWVCL
jgi:dynein heavy chain